MLTCSLTVVTTPRTPVLKREMLAIATRGSAYLPTPAIPARGPAVISETAAWISSFRVPMGQPAGAIRRARAAAVRNASPASAVSRGTAVTKAWSSAVTRLPALQPLRRATARPASFPARLANRPDTVKGATACSAPSGERSAAAATAAAPTSATVVPAAVAAPATARPTATVARASASWIRKRVWVLVSNSGWALPAPDPLGARRTTACKEATLTAARVASAAHRAIAARRGARATRASVHRSASP
jgi:hypothetical protein